MKKRNPRNKHGFSRLTNVGYGVPLPGGKASNMRTGWADLSRRLENVPTTGTELFPMFVPSSDTTLAQRKNFREQGGIKMKPTFFALILIDDQGAERFGGAFSDPALAAKKGEAIGKRFEVRPAFL
jgi:hypothetical protein